MGSLGLLPAAYSTVNVDRYVWGLIRQNITRGKCICYLLAVSLHAAIAALAQTSSFRIFALPPGPIRRRHFRHVLHDHIHKLQPDDAAAGAGPRRRVGPSAVRLL